MRSLITIVALVVILTGAAGCMTSKGLHRSPTTTQTTTNGGSSGSSGSAGGAGGGMGGGGY